ncbi:formin-like protein 16 [Gallus gallus]|uniref:formin-like protein 16 n=1 Tax=Gallus gallus TaxID=9031 RepID=UPI001F020E7E|nr:formin-like protein 16 [Gallus gallus]
MPPAPSRPTCPQPNPTDTILRREGGNRGSVPPGSAVAALPRHLTAVRAHRTAPPAPPARIPSPPAGAGVPGIYGPAAPAPACLLQQGRPPLAAAPHPAPQVGEPQRGPPGPKMAAAACPPPAVRCDTARSTSRHERAQCSLCCFLSC